MSSSITPYTPLKSICSMVLDETDKSIGDLDKVWILGHRALTKLMYDFAGQTKTVRLPVLANKTVPLPPDCISWSKIGILNDKGEINTLKVNNALTTFRDNNPNRLTDLSPDISGTTTTGLIPYYSNFFYGGSMYNLFGVGGGVVTYGDCKVDELNRIIILNTDFRYDAIMIEYMSSPEMDIDFQVPTYLQEAVIAFIKWKLKVGAREDFFAEAVSARRSTPKKKFILQSFNQVIRESNGMKLRS